jgi:hypothetical protein
MKLFLTPVLIFAFSFSILAQNFFFHGTVCDFLTNKPLGYANVRVLNTSIGTSTNKEGQYELRLSKGKYKIVVSYIGYSTDTLALNLENNTYEFNFFLHQSTINLPEVIVHPGENPAIKIIHNAIERKNAQNKILKSYEFEAYTKGVIKTQDDFRSDENNIGIGIKSDTSALKISGILENESIGYFMRPDFYKEVITARKQTANIPPSINILTGGRIVKNFSENYINFFGRDLPGPLAPNALDYYFFYIDKVTSINNKPVFKIYMTPNNQNDPGFFGDIYVEDSTFALIKIDLQLNRAANIGGILDSINIFQQFDVYNDSVYLPVDYRLYVTANVLNLAKFGFELNTILYNYKINPKLNRSLFDKSILTVLPDADKKDSSFWKEAITIPNTPDELKAYQRIDSITSMPQNFWNNFSLLSSTINLSNKFSISAPLAFYHFNRVEGNSLSFGMFLKKGYNQRLNSTLRFAYGFSDKKFKTDFDASYLLGNYRNYELYFSAFNKLNILFENSENYSELFSSLLALISKYDFRNYYYTNGFSFFASGDVSPVIKLKAGILSHTDRSAFKNTEFSFFAKDKKFNENPAIYDTKINALKAGFRLDFRDYIEDGYSRRRVSEGKSYITFDGDITYSDKPFLKSSLFYATYDFTAEGVLNTFKSQQLKFKIFGMYTKGKLPYQSLFALPGNIDLTAGDFTFRTLNLNEVLGDRVVEIFLQHEFGDEIFRALRLPYIKNWDLQLSTFCNAAYSNIGEGSKSILPKDQTGTIFSTKIFSHPFYEAGFELGQALFPFKLDFTWRLNYRGENNFRIGVNTKLLW